MPITQDRMERLLSAGEEFEMHWRAAIDQAAQQVTLVKAGRKTPEQALADLVLEMSAAPIGRASTVLALERQHYRLTRAKNARSKARAARRRGAELGEAPLRARTAAEIAAEVEREEQEAGAGDWIQGDGAGKE